MFPEWVASFGLSELSWANFFRLLSWPLDSSAAGRFLSSPSFGPFLAFMPLPTMSSRRVSRLLNSALVFGSEARHRLCKAILQSSQSLTMQAWTIALHGHSWRLHGQRPQMPHRVSRRSSFLHPATQSFTYKKNPLMEKRKSSKQKRPIYIQI